MSQWAEQLQSECSLHMGADPMYWDLHKPRIYTVIYSRFMTNHIKVLMYTMKDNFLQGTKSICEEAGFGPGAIICQPLHYVIAI